MAPTTSQWQLLSREAGGDEAGVRTRDPSFARELEAGVGLAALVAEPAA